MKIENLWQSYAAAVGVPMGGVQWTETRRAFYAGAGGLLAELRKMDDDEAAGVRMLEALSAEYRSFIRGVRAGKK